MTVRLKKSDLLPGIRILRSSTDALFCRRCCLAILLMLTVLHAAAGYGAQTDNKGFSFQDDDPKTPWHISADEIQYDRNTDEYIGTGRVVIEKKDRKLTADAVRFDRNLMVVKASGHVLLIVGSDHLVADRLEMDLNSETGTAYDGTLFFKENHFYIRGDVIQKTGKVSYKIQKATLTTCDGDRPAWKITGRNLKISIDGYGTTWHSILWARKIPVLYSPFMAFPVKSKRQSGFLMPRLGFSDRKGSEYDQPFFWAISDSTDATFYSHYMGERGEKIGAEYRYVLDEASRGMLMLDVLDDQKVDNGEKNSSDKWGYEDDDALRPNSDRYWFRMKEDRQLPGGFLTKLDIDVVSDQDYLQEFRNGYTGFNQTETYFMNTFGRDLDDYDDSVRVNRFNVSKNWSRYSLNAEARWYDDVVARRQEETDDTLQMLPYIEFNGSKQPIANSSFYFDLDSEYVYFYRQDGDKGHRADFHPRVYRPYRFENYFTFEPSVGVRETVWQLDEEDAASSDTDWKLHRELYDVKLDLNSTFFRIFEVDAEPFGGKVVDRIKHTLTPQIVYDYIPEVDQDQMPYFSSIDKIARENLITYSITNTFTSRSLDTASGSADAEPLENPSDTDPHYTYLQFCRLKFEQSFDINKSNEGDSEPFSTIYSELELSPFYYLSVESDSEWSTYDNEFVTHNIAMRLIDSRGDRILAEHRYEKESIESLIIDFQFKITARLFGHARYEANLYDDQDIETVYGVLYRSQCWSLEFQISDEEDERRYEAMINLYGIGGFGSGYDQSKANASN